jgi:inorganic pyrophosphatase
MSGATQDSLLLKDQPAFPACVVLAKLIGVLEAEQTESGRSERNDRLVAMADDAHNYHDLASLKDLFTFYNAMKANSSSWSLVEGRRQLKKLSKREYQMLQIDLNLADQKKSML